MATGRKYLRLAAASWVSLAANNLFKKSFCKQWRQSISHRLAPGSRPWLKVLQISHIVISSDVIFTSQINFNLQCICHVRKTLKCFFISNLFGTLTACHIWPERCKINSLTFWDFVFLHSKMVCTEIGAYICIQWCIVHSSKISEIQQGVRIVRERFSTFLGDSV